MARLDHPPSDAARGPCVVAGGDEQPPDSPQRHAARPAPILQQERAARAGIG